MNIMMQLPNIFWFKTWVIQNPIFEMPHALVRKMNNIFELQRATQKLVLIIGEHDL